MYNALNTLEDLPCKNWVSRINVKIVGCPPSYTAENTVGLETDFLRILLLVFKIKLKKPSFINHRVGELSLFLTWWLSK